MKVLLFFFGFMALLFSDSAVAQDVQELPTVTVSAGRNVSKRVARIFQKDFKGATQTRWYKANKNYLVEFLKDDMKQRALFKRSGRLIYHLAFGKEENLPVDIRQFIKDVYIDYKVTDALSVNQDNRTAWIINLEDKNTVLVVRAENGGLHRVAKYPKPAI